MTQIEALREEVAYLRAELGLSINNSHIACLRPLTVAEAKLVLALYAAKGRTLTFGQLVDSAVSDSGLAKALTCKIRKKMPSVGIETVWGVGYRMTAEGRAAVADRIGAK